MDIEIRRNRDISFEVTCENLDALKELFEMTEEQKREQERYEANRKRFEAELWDYFRDYKVRDLDGKRITKRTHEIGYDYDEPNDDGFMKAKTVWVRPKKSEYEK